MPLYARTEKRLKRKEREDELGITAVKQAMKEAGELDSASGSEEDSDFDEDEDESDSGVSGESSDEDEDEDGEEEEEEGSGEEEEDGDEEMASEADSDAFPLSIEEIETNPIYPLEENEGCLLCPGKLLKHAQMRETHLSSAPHKRAMKRWKARLAEVEERPFPSDDPRDLMNEILDDLEDRRTNTKPEPAAVESKEKEETVPVTTTADSKKLNGSASGGRDKAARRKDRRARTKTERKDQQAQEALKAVATPITDATTPTTAEKTEEVGKGLNRRARRMLAKQSAGPVAGAKAGGENGKSKSVKEKKDTKATPAPAEAPTPSVEGEGKEKKRRKRNSQPKA